SSIAVAPQLLLAALPGLRIHQRRMGVATHHAFVEVCAQGALAGFAARAGCGLHVHHGEELPRDTAAEDGVAKVGGVVQDAVNAVGGPAASARGGGNPPLVEDRSASTRPRWWRSG